MARRRPCAGGFAVGLPTAQVLNSSEAKSSLRKNLMSGLLVLPAVVKGPRSAECELPQLGSAGNTRRGRPGAITPRPAPAYRRGSIALQHSLLGTGNGSAG